MEATINEQILACGIWYWNVTETKYFGLEIIILNCISLVEINLADTLNVGFQKQ